MNNSRWKHIVGITGAICLLLALIASCSINQNDGERSNEKDPIVLRVLLEASARSEAIVENVESFEKQHNVDVEISMLGRENLDEKTLIDLSTESGESDVIYIFRETFAQYAKNGWLMPLDSYMEKSKKELMKEDFLEGSLDMCEYEEKTYGLPIYLTTCMMYYRTDLFEKAGIEAVPQTWEELKEACQKLKDIGVYPLAMRGNNYSYGGGADWHLGMLVYSFGAQYYLNYPEDLTPVLDSKEFVEAVSFYADLLNEYGVPGTQTNNYTDNILAVKNGNVGIWIDGAGLVTDYLTSDSAVTEENIGFASIPAGKAGKVAPKNVHMLSINAKSEHPKMAYKFIEWVTSIEHQTESTFIGTTRRSVFESTAYKEKHNYGSGAWLEVYKDSLKYAQNDYFPVTPEWPQVSKEISEAFADILMGENAGSRMHQANEKVKRIFISR